MNRPSRSLLGLAVAIGLSVSFAAQSAALISPDLQKRLLLSPTHEVVVTFSDRSQVTRLANLTSTTAR